MSDRMESRLAVLGAAEMNDNLNGQAYGVLVQIIPNRVERDEMAEALGLSLPRALAWARQVTGREQ